MAIDDSLHALLAAALGYLLGSVPFAYLLARSRRVDLRHTGSGVVSPANVYHALGLAAGAMAMVGDVGKAVLPVAVTRWLVGPEAAAYLALWVMVGHVWSPWLHFDGGRGMAIAVGTALVLLPREILLIAAVLLPVARLVHDTAPPAAATLVLVPLSAMWFGEPSAVVVAYAAMGVLILLRRVTAPSAGGRSPRALLSRLVFDRPDPRRHWTLDR